METYWDDFAEQYRKKHGRGMDEAVIKDLTVVQILAEFFHFLKDKGFGQSPD